MQAVAVEGGAGVAIAVPVVAVVRLVEVAVELFGEGVVGGVDIGHVDGVASPSSE